MSALDDDSFPVELTAREMQDFMALMDWLQATKALAFWPDGLQGMSGKINQVLKRGCYTHKTMMERIQVASDHVMVICKECEPKEYAKAMAENAKYREKYA